MTSTPSEVAPRRRRLRRIIAISITAVLVLIVVVGVAAFARLSGNLRTVDLHASDTGGGTTVDDYSGSFDVLVVGSDTRDGQGDGYGAGDVEGARNDVTLLLHVNEQHDAATVISFPRDLLVPLPACEDGNGRMHDAVSRGQFNQSLGRGGLGCVAATVSDLTGIDIAYAAETSFSGTIELSEAVGGVPVCFAGPIHDRHSGLEIPEAGTYDLEGEQALAFLRSRHGVGDGSDLARISSQQVFLASLVRTVQQKATLADPVRLFEIADAATRSMTLSTKLADLRTMASMAKVFSALPVENITFVSYPYLPAGDRVLPDEESAALLLEQVLSDRPVTLAEDSTGRGSELSADAAEESAARTPADEDDLVEDASSLPTGEGDDAGAENDAGSPVQPLDLDGQSAAQATCVSPYRG